MLQEYNWVLGLLSSYSIELHFYNKYLVTMATTIWSSCIGYIIMSTLSCDVYEAQSDQNAPYWVSLARWRHLYIESLPTL